MEEWHRLQHKIREAKGEIQLAYDYIAETRAYICTQIGHLRALVRESKAKTRCAGCRREQLNEVLVRATQNDEDATGQQSETDSCSRQVYADELYCPTCVDETFPLNVYCSVCSHFVQRHSTVEGICTDCLVER